MRATADPIGRNRPPPCSSEGWSGRRGSNPRPTAWKAVTLPLSYSRLRARVASLAHSAPTFEAPPLRARALAANPMAPPTRTAPLCQGRRGWWGGEGSNLRSPKAAGLQPAAIDRSATSPETRLSARHSRSCPGNALADVIHESLSSFFDTVYRWNPCVFGASLKMWRGGRWSWRRDLNPRPPDYKSGALPD